MTPARLDEITTRYAGLRLLVLGDFTLDRYLMIDGARAETSIETGLAVRNVTAVRALPGSAGTVLNNLVALGVGTIHAVGFCGEDGEGYELRRALGALPGVRLGHFLSTSLRRTFTYTKPMLEDGRGPARELERLDLKNWTPTPATVSAILARSLHALAAEVDGVIIMDQVDLAESGVVTSDLRAALATLIAARPGLLVFADSRRGLRGYPPAIFKMNATELAVLLERPTALCETGIQRAAAELAATNRKAVFITRAEHGIVGASPDGSVMRVPSLPLRGPIDIVGAGDAVTANLVAALAAGADMQDAMEIAMLAASLVVHQVGTTGTANVGEIRELSAMTGVAVGAQGQRA